jgi:O-antigen ligase
LALAVVAALSLSAMAPAGGNVGASVCLGLIVILGAFGPPRCALAVLGIGLTQGRLFDALVFGVVGPKHTAPFPVESVLAMMACLRFWTAAVWGAGRDRLVWISIGLVTVVEASLEVRAQEAALWRPFLGAYVRLAAVFMIFRTARTLLGSKGAHTLLAVIGFAQIPGALNYLLHFQEASRWAIDAAAAARGRTALGDANERAVLWALGVALLLDRPRASVWWGLSLGGVVLLTMAVICSSSRTGAVTLVAVWGGWLWLQPRLGWPAMLVGAAVAALTLVYSPMSVRERLFLRTGFEESRLEVWRQGWELFREHPVLGNGLTYYKGPRARLPSAAHNSLLEAGAAGGIVYAGVYGLMLVLMVWTAIRERRRQPSGLTDANLLLVGAYLVASQGLCLAGLRGGEVVVTIVLASWAAVLPLGEAPQPRWDETAVPGLRERGVRGGSQGQRPHSGMRGG